MVSRTAVASLLAATLASAAHAQGPIERAGRALDNAGRTIRYNVESAVARGEISSQERQLINQVSQRLNLDRRLLGSALQIVVEPGGRVQLRGSVVNDQARTLAVELVRNTVGVTGVVDELSVAKVTRVIETVPAETVVPVPTETIVVPATKPVQQKVIVTPR